MPLYAILYAPKLHNLAAMNGRAYAEFKEGALTVDDDMLPVEIIAEGREAAHMLMRLYDKQTKRTQQSIILILAQWRKSTRTAPPTTSGPETVST
jgi:hypothetical protein